MKNLVLAVALSVLVAAPGRAADDPKVTAEVLALAKAQIAATVAGKPVAERMAAASDDYTLFNPNYVTRVDGKTAVMGFNTGTELGGTRNLQTEILNPRVQTYGDTAILTYNAAGLNLRKDGTTNPTNSKITRVYARQGGRWQNVHTHISAVE